MWSGREAHSVYQKKCQKQCLHINGAIGNAADISNIS